MKLKKKLAIWWRGPDSNLENCGPGYYSLTPDSFRESNMIMSAPKGMEDTCMPLEVYKDHVGVTSCWKFPFRERLKMLIHGRVWLLCVGAGMPPVWVASGKTIFKPEEELN